MERVVVLVLGCFVLLAGPAAGANTRQSWASGAIQAVTSHGLFPGTPATFRPDDPLTAGDLAGMLTAIGDSSVRTPAVAGASVSIAGLDAAIVRALGLQPVAAQFADVARSAGLDPPSRFGTEVVARMLGLRYDLPPSLDSLEPQPAQPATRAEAAFSAARVLSLGLETPTPDPSLSPVAAADAAGGVQYVKGISASFAIPSLSPLQQEILRTAVSFDRLPVRLGRRGRERRARLRLLRLRLARLQAHVVRRCPGPLRHAEGPHGRPDGARGAEDASGSTAPTSSRATFSSSAPRPRPRRARSTTPRSTSATAG